MKPPGIFIKIFGIGGHHKFKTAEAVVLSVLPGNKLQLQVFPPEGRNFVTEVDTHSAISSYIKTGQRLCIRYIPDTQQAVEIINSIC